jgi:hypothetical protein
MVFAEVVAQLMKVCFVTWSYPDIPLSHTLSDRPVRLVWPVLCRKSVKRLTWYRHGKRRRSCEGK